MLPPPLTHQAQGQHHLQGVLPLQVVCSEVFPWSIKSAPPAIPFETPVAGMVEITIPIQFVVDIMENDSRLAEKKHPL